ncbi:putative bifunctional diguanylate cyclase/phosphodiesterase [Actinoplanes sp. HUAS TT8]|uniref:putative bifunctional diguanylate cyclase/phosphodiesterase n=1 Tax=Actinoplanes sp. HUAS TT8 TaxID=3447453 RepID=UPI003F5270B0
MAASDVGGGPLGWRRAPVGVLTIGLALVALVFAVFDDRARPAVIGMTVLGLDLAGAVCSWRAARHSPTGPVPWRLIAAGRAVSAGMVLCLWHAALGGMAPWWWAGAAARMLMYLLLAAGVLVPVVKQLSGRTRTAMLAEIGTVIAAGFMVIWYFALEPVLAHETTETAGIVTVGWPLGDVLLLAALASLILRGSVTRFAAPVTVFGTGLAVYLAADVLWLADSSDAGPIPQSPGVLFGLVAASLLMTAAPVLTLIRSGQPFAARTSRPPAWATHLPMTAMLVGCLLMLAATLLQGQLLQWGGLVCGLVVMTCFAALRQLISLRQGRDQLTTDALTGLANRAGLDEALDRALRRQQPVALLLIDLDGFKLVNDAYGHAAGDAFLAHVGRQLRSAVRGADVCARIGGDEFAVLLFDITDLDEAAATALRILTISSGHPVVIDDDLVPARASIGIAAGGPGFDAKTLLRQADTAMYYSKRAGSHSHATYQPSMVDRRADDVTLAEDLQHALHRGELHVLYQPQVDLRTGRMIAAEALVRWQHPTQGLIPPTRFIPVAERCGAITDIGLWVLEQALNQLAALPPTGPGQDPAHISVNLSPQQLRQPTIVHDILAVLDRTGADPRRLVLEVTESALVDETGGIDALRALREHGIRIAIDDFGTGYSSLQYLTRLPVDILKIDRSFVAELDNTPEGSAVADAIIRFAQVLHLDTVAEGIETEHHATELLALGCHIGQGYLYAKPLTPADLVAMAQDYQVATRPAVPARHALTST